MTASHRLLRRSLLLLGVLLPLVPVGAASAKQPKPEAPIELVGGWVNHAGCIPAGFGTTDDPQVFTLECTGGSIWNGDLSGHTVVHAWGTIATDGSMQGEFEERFIGTYLGDHSVGSLHTRGTLTIDNKGAFRARAEIIGGTCDWAGSTGSIAFDGYQLNGGYVGTWLRPHAEPSSTPCPPVQSADDLPRPDALD